MRLSLTLLLLERPDRIDLSLATDQPIAAKTPPWLHEGLAGRSPVQDHLRRLDRRCAAAGHLLPAEAPMLAVGCRNVLANLRCGAWLKGGTPGFVTVAGEDNLQATRTYVLGVKEGRLVVEEYLPTRDPLEPFGFHNVLGVRPHGGR